MTFRVCIVFTSSPLWTTLHLSSCHISSCSPSDSSTDDEDTHGDWAAIQATDDRISCHWPENIGCFGCAAIIELTFKRWPTCGIRPLNPDGYLQGWNAADPHGMEELGGRTFRTWMKTHFRASADLPCLLCTSPRLISLILFICLLCCHKNQWIDKMQLVSPFGEREPPKPWGTKVNQATLPAGKQQARGGARGRMYVCSFPQFPSNGVCNIGIICWCSTSMFYPVVFRQRADKQRHHRCLLWISE